MKDKRIIALQYADQSEIKKCEDSPLYFHNKYVRKEGQKELTQEEFDLWLKKIENERNLCVKPQTNNPLLINEMFKT